MGTHPWRPIANRPQVTNLPHVEPAFSLQFVGRRPIRADRKSAPRDNRLVGGFQSKHWGWWYLCISVHLLHGARLGAIVLRIGVAVGFALLGWMQFRYGR